MRHATSLLYHINAVASRNRWFASCGNSGNLFCGRPSYASSTKNPIFDAIKCNIFPYPKFKEMNCIWDLVFLLRPILLERFHTYRLCRCRLRRRMQCYQMESFTRSPVRQKFRRRLRHSEMQPEMISTCRRSERPPACRLQCFLMSPFTHR